MMKPKHGCGVTVNWHLNYVGSCISAIYVAAFALRNREKIDLSAL